MLQIEYGLVKKPIKIFGSALRSPDTINCGRRRRRVAIHAGRAPPQKVQNKVQKKKKKKKDRLAAIIGESCRLGVENID